LKIGLEEPSNKKGQGKVEKIAIECNSMGKTRVGTTQEGHWK